VCPTGVFTDKTLKQHYTRKWDLQTAPSVCVHCGLGCNTIPGERYGTLRRILNRYNHEVNGYFLCDRGRFGYEFVNSDKRIRQPLIKNNENPPQPPFSKGGNDPMLEKGAHNTPPFSKGGRGGFESMFSDHRLVTKEIALKHIADILTKSHGIIGIGSPRASLEANFALRTLVGPEQFYSGMSENESHLISQIIGILRDGPARSPSLHDVEQADAALVLGVDVTNEAPMLALALRQSVRRKPMEIAEKLHIPEWDDAAVRHAMQHEKGPLFIATLTNTKLDDVATKTYRASPDDIARFGFAVAHELDPSAPAVPGIPDLNLNPPQSPFSKGGSEAPQLSPPLAKGGKGGFGEIAPESILTLAREIAQALKNAKRPLIISGTGCGSEAIVQAAANVAWALCGNGRTAELCFVMPECNSMGLGLMEGKNLAEIMKTPSPLAGEGRGEGSIKADTVIILENDLYRRADEKSVVEFLSSAKHVVVIDHLLNATSSKAEVVLPAGTFAESDGIFVNNEGRAQRSYQVFVPQVFSPEDAIQESRQWIHDIIGSIESYESKESEEFTKSHPWVHQTRQTLQTLDSLDSAIAEAMPVFKPILAIAPTADFRIHDAKIPRQPHRYSGRTAMLADANVHEPKQPDDADTPLAFSMEGYEGQPPPALVSRYWAPGWNSVQALNKFQQEVGGPLRGGDPGKRLINPPQSPFSKGGLESSLPPLTKGGEEGFFFTNIPESFKPRAGEWLLVPLYHIFGSEELSVLSSGIAERVTKPYVALNPEDAAKLNVNEREEVTVTFSDKVRRLSVKLMSDLPSGIAGLPSSLDGLQGNLIPLWCKLKKTS
jgi:NADH-quinone oxidoreductase subunit G